MIHSPVDILLVLIVVYNVLRGWQSGFIFGLLDLVAWSGSLLAAFRLYDLVGRWLASLASLPEVLARPIAFALVALGSGALLGLVGHALAQRLPARAHTHDVNRIFGLLTGLVNGLIVVAILASLLVALPLTGNLRVATRDSGLANHFASLTQELEADLTPIFGDALSQTLNLLTVHPESDELIWLPYRVADAAPVPELEAEMLRLVNEERGRAGLPSLEMDPALVEVARRHSDDMLVRGYFSHTTPDGLTPFDRIQAAGITYQVAGENLAHASTLAIAHTGLMNSPGHRANILRPEFGRVGIGILDAGPRGLMITQNFRD